MADTGRGEQIMGNNLRIMTCSDGYLVGRPKNGQGRDGFKVRKGFTFQGHYDTTGFYYRLLPTPYSVRK